MTPGSQSGKNWQPISLILNVKARLPHGMDSNKVGQVLLCKYIKKTGRVPISPRIVLLESIIKEYLSLKREIGKKISLLYRILLSAVGIVKDIKN